MRAEPKRLRPQVTDEEMFDQGHIRMATDAIHTVKPLEVDISRGRLVAVTGVSGSGRRRWCSRRSSRRLRLRQLASAAKTVRWIDAEGYRTRQPIDATPIGANVRSTVGDLCRHP
ncbi:MAG: hypothetical protein ACLU0O_06160 [Collinsella sp.]